MKSIKQVEPKPYYEVHKQNDLLQARYELSELALKLVSTVISMVKKEDDLFQVYILKITDFKELAGLTGNSIYSNLENSLNELMKAPITIHKDELHFLKFMWFASAEYKGADGTLEIELSQKIRPYLLELKGDYLSYEIKNILSLKSGYIIRLYELLKHEYNKVNNYTNNKVVALEDIDIDEFKHMFAIPDSYSNNHIKERIIEPALIQLEEKTDIKFEISYVKLGRAIKWLRFVVRENNPLHFDFLKDRKSFISHMRKNYVNRDVYEDLSNNMTLAISPKGHLYNKRNNLEYDKAKANKAWDSLYKMAKDDKLEVLKNI